MGFRQGTCNYFTTKRRRSFYDIRNYINENLSEIKRYRIFKRRIIDGRLSGV
ncbi:hypothetical protein HMPREF0322_00786 [Desulfitobacterium hafniense DP7]|uniref:Uncharacterized protein n=1 Tax=Desulfitobacterium hafniense DP7 TaxID=537010 RepID=G9XIL0_DESHA|nr:hypothetical protein HMPREF0322_00786 [Desulfitobacterium hafniense DP7]